MKEGFLQDYDRTSDNDLYFLLSCLGVAPVALGIRTNICTHLRTAFALTEVDLLSLIAITEIDTIPFILFFALVSAFVLGNVNRRSVILERFILDPVSTTFE